MNNCIVIVLDGLGIGETPDVPAVRPADCGANTLAHILERCPNIRIPNLVQLGILDALRIPVPPQQKNACYSRIRFAHEGADTFMGHQEIMGTRPAPPIRHSLTDYIEAVSAELVKEGYRVERVGKAGEAQMLIVNQCMTVADNVECDPRSAINVTGALDICDFETIRQVALTVRKIVKLPRVIAMGGRGITFQDIMAAVQRPNGLIGVNAPLSGVFRNDYHCIHMGYGVDTKKQLPHLLSEHGIHTCLIGKAADLVVNENGESISMVPTAKVLDLLTQKAGELSGSFLCANVQETDLAGHAQDVHKYAQVLETADEGIGRLRHTMDDSDFLMIIADHGNDPTICHSRHTREFVPLLVYHYGVRAGQFKQQETLACVAATAADFFGVKYDLFGNTFLPLIKK